MNSVSDKIVHAIYREKKLAFLHQPLVLSTLVLLFFCVTAMGQTPPEPAPTPDPASANPCDKQNKSVVDTVNCFKHYIDKVTNPEGVHLVLGSIAPGSGLTGGVGYGKSKVSEKWRIRFSSLARISIRKYWEVDANLRLTKNSNSFSSTNTNGPSSNFKINIYGQIKDLRRLDFFGLGPESREQDRAVFHYREGVIGADFSKPVGGSLDVGGAAEGIFPNVITIADPTVRSVERVYNSVGAPGIASQPKFFHVALFAGVHSEGQPESRKVDYRFLYHFFQDAEDLLYSFRRFDADLKHKFPFGKNEVRIRGRVSLSDTSAGQRVPFYLMPTLGGANLQWDDTLRGFRNYRFRDRNLALLQMEYMRTIYGPVNVMAFYDTGKVASSFSAFDIGRLRHTYGFGMVIVPRRSESVLIRFYVALGSGEGMRTYIGSGDLLGGRSDRLLR